MEADLCQTVELVGTPSSFSTWTQKISFCFHFQTMKIKLQPASGTELPAFSPLLPPAVVSQVLLLANPHKVRGSGSAVCH